MFTGLVEVEDLDASGEVEAGVLPDPGGTVAEVDRRLCGGVAAAQGFGTQLGAGGAAVIESADVGGGGFVAQGLTVFVGGGLGEDAPQLDLPGACGAVRLAAFDPGKFSAAQGHAGAVARGVEYGDGFLVDRGRPGVTGGAQFGNNVGNQAYEAASFDRQAEVGMEVSGGSLVGAAHRGGAADESGEAGHVPTVKIQALVERAAAGAGSGVVVVAPPQGDGAEERPCLTLSVLMHDLQRTGRLAVGEQSAVVEYRFHEGAGIAEHRVAQAALQGLAQDLDAFLREPCEGGVDPCFGLAVAFREASFAEFFSASASTVSGARAARCAAPSEIARAAS